jgi:hypothetical protein
MGHNCGRADKGWALQRKNSRGFFANQGFEVFELPFGKATLQS